MAEDRAPAEEESALVVTVPEAEPLIGDLRQRHDPSAAVGVPAHVTVLYPFMPPARIDASVEAALRSLFADVAAFGYRFERVERFGDTTVFLAPEPVASFAALIRAAAAAWPEYPPYGGVHETVIPHLTVGDRLDPGAADAIATQAQAALARSGPVVGSAASVELIVEHDGRWATARSFPLGER